MQKENSSSLGITQAKHSPPQSNQPGSSGDLFVEDKGARRWPIASEGPHNATLEQIVDLGPKETSFGIKHKVRLVWRLDDEHGPNGEDLRAFESHTKIWNEKSFLRKRVVDVLGHDPGPRFNLASLVGTRARIVITHNVVGTKTYVNVASARPLGVFNG